MPKTSYRPVRCPPIPAEGQKQQEMYDFSLPGMMPKTHTLVLNAALGTLAYLVIEQERPFMLIEQQFTTNELYLLLPLLQSYPYYCPHEVLLAYFTSGQGTEEAVIKARNHLHHASMQSGMWDQQMRPVRNALSRIRFKLRYFGIKISSIPETGYVLMKDGLLLAPGRPVE